MLLLFDPKPRKLTTYLNLEKYLRDMDIWKFKILNRCLVAREFTCIKLELGCSWFSLIQTSV